jgi:hypothetical protein
LYGNSHWSRHAARGASFEAEWSSKLAEHEKKYPEEAAEFKALISGKLPEGWDKALPVRIWTKTISKLLLSNFPCWRLSFDAQLTLYSRVPSAKPTAWLGIFLC